MQAGDPAPVMLIIDALLGLAISFEEFRNGDQAIVYELDRGPTARGSRRRRPAGGSHLGQSVSWTA